MTGTTRATSTTDSTNRETTTEPQTDGGADEQQPDEQRSASSIVADLIQEMNAAGQPVTAEPEPTALGADAEPDTAGVSEQATAEVPAEDSGAEAEPGVAAERAAIEVTSEEPAPAAEADAGKPSEESAEEEVDEPDVLIELDVDPGAIEAILLVVDEPLTSITLASVLDRPEHAVAEALRGLAMAYDAERRGFDLREVAGGWRLYTREEYAGVVEKFVLDGQQAKLTQASLETLAVVAYRQPVSRSRVSAIRGVNCDGVMRTLISRGLVEEAGVEGDSGATLYRTTSYFLERLGLNSIDELPDLAPYLPEMDEIEDAIHSEPISASAPETDEPAEPDEQ